MREIEMKRSHGSVRALALFAYISVIITSLSGCKDDKDSPSAHMGKVRLSLSADTTSLKKGIHSSVTKAVSDEFADFLTVDDYRILVVAGTDTAKQYDRFDKMPAEFELPEGTYSLIASKGNNLPAEYENPYFEGSTDFTVKEGMSSPLDVTCSLGNTRIMAEYTDDFKEAYSEYTVLLSSANTTADFEIAKGETRPAYMQVAKDGTDIAVGIRLKKVNAEEEKTYYVPNAIKMERRQNVRLIFKTDGEALEGIGLDVMLDDSLATQSFTTKIPDFMWQQFEKPTLSADGFKDGEKRTIKTSVFEDDLRIGFTMPAGIGSLIIKQWIGDEEADATSIDLVTNPELAIKKGFSWMIGEKENPILKDIRQPGYLSLKDAIKSLKAPEEGTTVYHYKFCGMDATGKQYVTNELNLTLEVQAASAPYIADYTLPAEIVEGDLLAAAVSTKLIAEGGIQEDKTVLTIKSESGMSISFPLKDNNIWNTLQNDYGITVESTTTTEVGITFNENFTTFFSAPQEGGSELYQINLSLEDFNGKKKEVSKRIVVKAPVFEFLTTEGDAFAKRIVLRVNTSGMENKKHLSFDYKSSLNIGWSAAASTGIKEDNGMYVDTLKGLAPNTSYSLRAVYNRGKKYERYAYLGVDQIVTEIANSDLPNAGFEYWSLAKDVNGSNAPALTQTITGGVTSGWYEKISAPYRFWEIAQPWDDNHSETKGWNTLNEYTTKDGKPSKSITFASMTFSWTRYAANSGTIQTEGTDGSAALIRTVGWGEGNSAVGEEIHAIIKNITPGELFLGSNSDKDKIYQFNSRPSKLKFDYKYETKNGSDHFVVEIVLKDEKGNLVTRSSLLTNKAITNTNWSTVELPLEYVGSSALLKAAQIYIRFASSNSNNYDFLRDNLIIWPADKNLSNGEYVGSQLYIDNVELIYE